MEGTRSVAADFAPFVSHGWMMGKTGGGQRRSFCSFFLCFDAAARTIAVMTQDSMLGGDITIKLLDAETLILWHPEAWFNAHTEYKKELCLWQNSFLSLSCILYKADVRNHTGEAYHGHNAGKQQCLF